MVSDLQSYGKKGEWDRDVGVSVVPVPLHTHCLQSIRGRTAGPGAGLASGAAGAGPLNADTQPETERGFLTWSWGKVDGDRAVGGRCCQGV